MGSAGPGARYGVRVMKPCLDWIRTRWSLMAALALVAGIGPSALGQASSPFGVNDPGERTRDMAGSLRDDMIGRQRAVSAEIVHNTPDRLQAVYDQMFFNNQARLYAVGARGSVATERNRRTEFVLDHLTYTAIQARNTQEYVTRSRGGYMNPGGLSGPPGSDLLLRSPQAVEAEIRADLEAGEQPPGMSPPAGPAGVPVAGVVGGFVAPQPIGAYGYGFAPVYGPR